jgi:hypothetical protein
MATFIHIADERKLLKIKQSGIKISKKGERKGIYCFPVLKDYMLTHQWARELKRRGVKTFVCIQFKIDDKQIVEIGKYNGDKLLLPANEAIETIMNHNDPEGLEIKVLEKVYPVQIQRIYPAPRITGWRYYPEAKGRKPFCHCRYCNRGEIKANRIIIDE